MLCDSFEYTVAAGYRLILNCHQRLEISVVTSSKEPLSRVNFRSLLSKRSARLFLPSFSNYRPLSHDNPHQEKKRKTHFRKRYKGLFPTVKKLEFTMQSGTTVMNILWDRINNYQP